MFEQMCYHGEVLITRRARTRLALRGLFLDVSPKQCSGRGPRISEINLSNDLRFR